MRLGLQLLMRKYPKSSFRRPMEGRGAGREKTKKGFYLWPLSFGELEEEVVIHGRRVPNREMVPQIMVPDLKDCKLQPYVTFRAEGVNEPPIQSRDLFDMFYKPNLEAEITNVPLEDIPHADDKESNFFSYFTKKKS